MAEGLKAELREGPKEGLKAAVMHNRKVLKFIYTTPGLLQAMPGFFLKFF